MSKELESLTEKTWFHAKLKCKVVFVRQSHRCGYVRVPKTHVAYGKSYDDLPIEVHGGLTCGDADSTNEDFQWFGFDCAHLGDDSYGEGRGHFWTLIETIKETNKMADQLRKLTLKAIIEGKLRWQPDWISRNVTVKENPT